MVDNFGMDWSGSGWSSKEVLNEINSIPDVKPPPKHSTTRAQPRSHNGLKNIVEGDFHYHNKIENVDPPPDNSVQVDDFYYDYNFINFHVDLSDDFDSDTDPGDSHRLSSPQGVEPTHSVKENIFLETTSAPTTTLDISLKTATHTVIPEEPGNTNQEDLKDDGKMATKEPITEDSENLDDLLSEDFLLPVYTTSSPPLPTTQLSPTLRHGHHRWPESVSTEPSVFTGKEQDVKHGGEADNSTNKEDDSFVTFTVTPSSAASTPSRQTTINTVVVTTVTAQEAEEYEYYFNEKSTLDPDILTGQEDVVSTLSPESLPGTVIQVETEIPQTTSQSIILPTASTLDWEQTDFHTVSTTRQYSQDLDLSAMSLPVSENPSPVPVPSLASDDSTSPTGTKIIPLTNPEGATTMPVPTEPVLDETTGTDPDSQTTSTDFDYNEIIVPMMVRSSSDGALPYQPPTTTAATSLYATSEQILESLTPAASILPTGPPTLGPPPALTSVQTSTSASAYWVIGKWSPVSLNRSTDPKPKPNPNNNPQPNPNQQPKPQP